LMLGDRSAITREGSKPASTCWRLTNVRTSNPAPTRTTNDTATCATTSARCACRCVRPAVVRPPLAPAEMMDEAAPADGSRGAQANTNAAATLTTNEKASTTPFNSTVSVMPTPWNEHTKLMHVAIKGFDVKPTEQPKANLVFLIDVSGSMDEPDKLPLLKSAFRLLVKLGTDPKVSYRSNRPWVRALAESRPGAQEVQRG